MVKNGCGPLSKGTLKSTWSQEWIDELSWFFACWYKFRKAKSNFDNLWVGMVENGRGLLVHGIVKSGVSQEWFDESS